MNSSSNSCERSGRDSEHREQPAANDNSRSTARALQAVVRRILRTQSQRTQLEKAVCREAQQILSSGFTGLSRDSVVALIVDNLQHRLSGLAIAGPGVGNDSARFAGSRTIAVARGSSR